MSFEDVKGLHHVRETRSFSHEFFKHMDVLKEDFDAYVLDVSVVYSTACGRKYVSDLFATNSVADEAVDILGEESFEEIERGGTDVLQYKSTPYSRAKTVQNIDAQLYVPDITRDCVMKSPSDMSDREAVLEAFEEISAPLEVKNELGIEEYSREGLENSVGIDEDEAIIRASEGLNGDVCILTYDSDYLEADVDATIPEFLHDF